METEKWQMFTLLVMFVPGKSSWSDDGCGKTKVMPFLGSYELPREDLGRLWKLAKMSEWCLNCVCQVTIINKIIEKKKNTGNDPTDHTTQRKHNTQDRTWAKVLIWE